MKLKTLFDKELKIAIKNGTDHIRVNCLAGCLNIIVLTAAEAVASKAVFNKFMADHLWNDPEMDAEPGWLFGSPETMLSIGLVPLELAKERLGLNRQNWHSYSIVI